MLVAQSRPTLCNPTDCSPPGSSDHGILQARILEWVATPFSRVSSRPRDGTQVSWIAGRFFAIWATGKPLEEQYNVKKMVRVSTHALLLNLVGRILSDSLCFTTEITMCFFFSSVLIWFVFVFSRSVLSDSLDPIDYSPPGSFIQGILWVRRLKWAAIPFSRGSSRPRDQAESPALQADSLPSELLGKC